MICVFAANDSESTVWQRHDDQWPQAAGQDGEGCAADALATSRLRWENYQLGLKNVDGAMPNVYAATDVN